jgi:hypothetical protein
MPLTSHDIYPLAQRLHAQLPQLAWMREVGDWEEYTHVADALHASCREAAVEEP